MLDFIYSKIYRNHMDDNAPISVPSINPQAPEEVSTNDSQTANHHKFFKKFLLFIATLALLPVIFFIVNLSRNIYKSYNPAQYNPARKFQLKESSPADQDSSFSTIGQPTFVFSKKIGIPESDLGKYFHISPGVSGSWHLEKK